MAGGVCFLECWVGSGGGALGPFYACVLGGILLLGLCVTCAHHAYSLYTGMSSYDLGFVPQENIVGKVSLSFDFWVRPKVIQ